MTSNPKPKMSESERLEAWRKFDRVEDKVMSLYASEASDPGSTGCNLSLEDISDLMPDRPEG